MSEPPAAPEPPEPVARPAGLVSLATMCSRVTGLLREAVFAGLFGTHEVADACVFAFRIPNLMRGFFAEGALASAFVPAFAEAREREGEERAFQLARRVLGTLGAAAGLVVLLGILFAPAVVSVVATDAPAAWRPLTIRLTRIMFPFLLLVAWASVVMGVLNTYRRYFLPALAPASFNLVTVVGGGVLLVLALPAQATATAWAALIVAGGAVQLLVQLPALRKVGLPFRPRLDARLRDPGLRVIVRRMGPVVLSLTATNVMLVITTAIASREVGWASSLNYAFRLVHLPIGVVGVALGTVVLAAGSRRSARDDRAGVDDVVRRGLRLNWYLALPAATGLFVLAEPIVRLVYERGSFGPESAARVATALRWYAGGIVFYAGVKAAAPHFLAHGDTRTPVLCSLLGIGANLAVAFGFVGSLGFGALALAVAVGAATNYLALRAFARRRHGPASAPGWGYLLRCLLGCAVIAGIGWVTLGLLPGRDGAVAGRWLQGLLTVGLVIFLAVLYFLVTAALGIEEGALLRRRLLRGRRL